MVIMMFRSWSGVLDITSILRGKHFYLSGIVNFILKSLPALPINLPIPVGKSPTEEWVNV
jgi:hypothetical protein